jgi:hypothetical protein
MYARFFVWCHDTAAAAAAVVAVDCRSLERSDWIAASRSR